MMAMKKSVWDMILKVVIAVASDMKIRLNQFIKLFILKNDHL